MRCALPFPVFPSFPFPFHEQRGVVIPSERSPGFSLTKNSVILDPPPVVFGFFLAALGCANGYYSWKHSLR